MNCTSFRELVFFLLCLTNIRLAISQLYGPGDCLINRLDVIPCEFRNPNLRKPGVEQQGIYNTRFRPGSAGSPECRVRNKDHNVISITSIGSNDRVKLIFSPGFLTAPDPTEYGNQQLVVYNITCQPDQLSYFDLMEIDMEEANCLDPSLMRNRCIDYVFVDQSPFGTFEHCGKNVSTMPDPSALRFANVTVMFRTSRADRFRGFQASVVCFEPEDRDRPGCTPGASGMSSETPMQTEQRRRKREAEKKELEEFHNQWKRKLAAIKRRSKRQQLDETLARFMDISVPNEVSVMYDQRTLKFVDKESRMPLLDTNDNVQLGLTDIDNVVFLHTFDRDGKIDSFRDSFPAAIPGPGPMFIVGRHAYFQLFIIDPRGLLPTEEEAAAITNITAAQFNVVPVEMPLDPSFLNPPTVDPLSLGLPPSNFRKRRQVTTINSRARDNQRLKRQDVNEENIDDSAFTDDDIILALMNENACNPVLRSTALATIEFVQRFNQQRIEMLRESLMATGSGDDGGMLFPDI